MSVTIQQIKGANFGIVHVPNAMDGILVPRVYRDHTEIGTKTAEYPAILGVNELAFADIPNRHYWQIKWQALEAKLCCVQNYAQNTGSNGIDCTYFAFKQAALYVSLSSGSEQEISFALSN